jgi:hypothetical protein
MYSLEMTTDQHASVVIFFVIFVLIGAFFIVNICLAVISDCYNAAISAATAKKPEIRREKLKQKLMEMGLTSRSTVQSLFAEIGESSSTESNERPLGRHQYVRARAPMPRARGRLRGLSAGIPRRRCGRSSRWCSKMAKRSPSRIRIGYQSASR